MLRVHGELPAKPGFPIKPAPSCREATLSDPLLLLMRQKNTFLATFTNILRARILESLTCDSRALEGPETETLVNTAHRSRGALPSQGYQSRYARPYALVTSSQ